MGKKSRRRPRQEKKYTIDDLDDDTAKPTPAPDDLEIYRRCNGQHEGDHDKMIASFAALPERQKQAYAMMAKEKRVLFDRRVAFCAKSGPDLVGELFLEATTIASFEVRGLGACKPSGVDIRVVGLNQSVAARRSYEFVSEDGFDWETGTRIANGRVISSDDYREITRVSNEVGLAPTDAYYKIVLPRLATEGVKGALKAIKKWPRVRPYWKRVRRRICFNCAKQVAPSEPRYMVCSGCGDARYCSEECQRRDWRAAHQKVCPAARPG